MKEATSKFTKARAVPQKIALRTREAIRTVSYQEAQQELKIEPPKGVTKVSPIKIFYNEKGGKSIRPRRVGDELEERALKRGERPSKRALKMANALCLERIMESGKYANITQLAKRTRICRNRYAELLEMLNRSREEIEAILFELV